MNNQMGQPEPASADSGPSTIEIIIGLLALLLALAAVVVGVAQYLLARAERRRQSDPESGQPNTEMMPVVPSHTSTTDSVTANRRQVTIMSGLARMLIKSNDVLATALMSLLM
jgi:flagellar basal body-associated protein FliL